MALLYTIRHTLLSSATTPRCTKHNRWHMNQALWPTEHILRQKEGLALERPPKKLSGLRPRRPNTRVRFGAQSQPIIHDYKAADSVACRNVYDRSTPCIRPINRQSSKRSNGRTSGLAYIHNMNPCGRSCGYTA